MDNELNQTDFEIWANKAIIAVLDYGLCRTTYADWREQNPDIEMPGRVNSWNELQHIKAAKKARRDEDQAMKMELQKRGWLLDSFVKEAYRWLEYGVWVKVGSMGICYQRSFGSNELIVSNWSDINKPVKETETPF